MRSLPLVLLSVPPTQPTPFHTGQALSTDLLSGLGAAVVKTRPRILVCTPSNAACDELLARVMAQGFCDGSGEGGRVMCSVGAGSMWQRRERSTAWWFSRGAEVQAGS